MGRESIFVCFGELLIRLGAPGRELLLQTPALNVCIGGAEANVAVSLAALGRRAAMASAVPPNALGEAALGELRRRGVDVSAVRSADGRMGLYFLAMGAVQRASQVLYDRAGSAFALCEPAAYDWPAILEGAAWLHVSGVTPAVSAKAADAALAAVSEARRRGVKVSFDGNYRAQLWAGRAGEAPAILRALLTQAHLAFVNARDLALVFGREFADARDANAAAFDAFANLEIVAATERSARSVDDQDLAGVMALRGGDVFRSRTHRLSGIIDRVGAGDAFAAGLLHAIDDQRGGQYAIDFATAAAVVKHSIPGDANIAGAAEIEATMRGDGADIRR